MKIKLLWNSIFNQSIFSLISIRIIFIKNKGMIALILTTMVMMGIEGNYIINGDFQNPQIPPMSFIHTSAVEGWYGNFDLIGSLDITPNPFDTQCIDLDTVGQGQLIQDVIIPASGIFILSYETSAFFNTSIETNKVQIYCNDKLIATETNYVTKIHTKRFIFQANKGVNQLRFFQLGINDFRGYLLNDICIEQLSKGGCSGDYKEQLNAKLRIIPYILSFVSISQIRGFKYMGLFMDDLSLYFYDQRNYNRTMQEILYVFDQIEEIQWSLLNMASKVPIDKFMIPMSDLIPFSNQKHMETDGVDDSFVRGIFPFVLFGVPPILVTTFIFYRLFRCLFNYKISSYVRRFYFVLPCLLQSLIEGNISFFTYIFFRQCFLAFSFKFLDKVFIATAFGFFFFVIMMACCFYFLGNRYYKKKFGYFIYCFYRTYPSMVYLSFQLVMRGIVRGVIHSCLHNYYGVQIILLCIMQALIILVGIWLENKYTIFMNKLMFSLKICYHFAFILLNISLWTEQQAKKNGNEEQIIELLLFFQKMIIYSLLAISVLQFVVDFIPNDFLHPKKKIKKDQQKQAQQNNQMSEEIPIINQQHKQKDTKQNKRSRHFVFAKVVLWEGKNKKTKEPIKEQNTSQNKRKQKQKDFKEQNSQQKRKKKVKKFRQYKEQPDRKNINRNDQKLMEYRTHRNG